MTAARGADECRAVGRPRRFVAPPTDGAHCPCAGQRSARAPCRPRGAVLPRRVRTCPRPLAASSLAPVFFDDRAVRRAAEGGVVAHVDVRERPFLHEEYCKGCGRCIEACARGCIAPGTEINGERAHPDRPRPRGLQRLRALRRGLPRALRPRDAAPRRRAAEAAAELPRAGRDAPAPRTSADSASRSRRACRSSMKGTYAAAIGALLAGCRHFFGYPITPSTEGAELMAKLLPAARRRSSSRRSARWPRST